MNSGSNLVESDPYAPVTSNIAQNNVMIPSRGSMRLPPQSTRASDLKRGFIPLMDEELLKEELNDISGIAND